MQLTSLLAKRPEALEDPIVKVEGQNPTIELPLIRETPTRQALPDLTTLLAPPASDLADY